MIEDVAGDGTSPAPFAVDAEPPWLLHVSDELDVSNAPELTKLLEARSSAAASSGSISPVSRTWTRRACT